MKKKLFIYTLLSILFLGFFGCRSLKNATKVLGNSSKGLAKVAIYKVVREGALNAWNLVADYGKSAGKVACDLGKSVNKRVRYEKRRITSYLRPEKIPTINKDLNGKTHPKVDVPYVERVTKNSEGIFVKGVFPVFKSLFKTKLPKSLYLKCDAIQFAYAINQLKDLIIKNPKLGEKFTAEQLEQIMNGRTPVGYTWHHNELPGVLELVDTNIHGEARHTGGRNIWGGGTEKRKCH